MVVLYGLMPLAACSIYLVARVSMIQLSNLIDFYVQVALWSRCKRAVVQRFVRVEPGVPSLHLLTLAHTCAHRVLGCQCCVDILICCHDLPTLAAPVVAFVSWLDD